MKNIFVVMVVFILSTFGQVHADGWLSSLTSLLGNSDESADEIAQPNIAQPSISGLVQSVTEGLNVSDSQAQGGLASIFSLAKNNLSAEQFSNLGSALPGVDQLIDLVPDTSGQTEQASSGLSGLLGKAAEYNESAKALSTVTKQFEALGLKPEMITNFIQIAKSYLDNEQGQGAKDLLIQGLGSLMG